MGEGEHKLTEAGWGCETAADLEANTEPFIKFYFRKLIFELDLAQNQTWKVKLEDIVFRDTVNLFETSVS